MELKDTRLEQELRLGYSLNPLHGVERDVVLWLHGFRVDAQGIHYMELKEHYTQVRQTHM